MVIDSNSHPVIFGEVLFDVFPDGTAVLGGAPFNVAWHLQGLGFAPLFVSRVGKDKRGDQILRQMDQWGMDSSGVTQDSVYPTGIVNVTLEAGQPSFDIARDAAYDHIGSEIVRTLYQYDYYSILYHGSLINRTAVSARTLSLLRQTAPGIFVDINLRAPWWSKDKIGELLQGINWLKLNDAELQALTNRDIENTRQIEQAARAMLDKYQWDALIVTRGAQGALLVTGEQASSVTPVKVERMVDTVGAGDGFSAVCLAGIIRGWSYAETLKRAAEFAAAICQLRGAISQDEDFYSRYRNHWML